MLPVGAMQEWWGINRAMCPGKNERKKEVWRIGVRKGNGRKNK
jgi:hypothetical protein